MSAWYVYVLRCADETFYTGVTTDIKRRLEEHNYKRTGAAYTKARRPVSLVYSEESPNRSEALKREHQLRKLKRSEKEKLIAAHLSAMQQ